MSRLLVYTQHISPRLRYIVYTLFGDDALLGSDLAEALAFDGPVINYSRDILPGISCRIVPKGLLQEQSIHGIELDTGQWQDMPMFFQTAGDIPFDIFSAAFYLISRYEEYLPHEADHYGRYAHTNSVAYQLDFLQRPLVNEWLQALQLYLQQLYPNWRAAQPVFYLKPSYDIDMAYRYRHHAPFRNIAAFFRDLLQGKLDTVLERAQVYSGRQHDPYDVYDWLHQLHQEHALEPLYFFLLAEKRKGVDKNLDPFTPGMRQLVQSIAAQYATGIHPSWQSGDDEAVLQREKKLLTYYSGRPVTASRQHYLRLTLPHTYRRLLDADIQADYSMAYGTVNGFRASWTLPFYWYDLERDMQTSLLIYPFCYMDSTAIFWERLTIDEAAAELETLYQRVRQVNGLFMPVFHNHFLTEQQEWVGWRQLYQDFLERNG